MAASKNFVIIIGNLGKDPEVRQTNNGNTAVNLAVATTDKFKDQQGNWTEKTEWHRIIAFGTRAETMGKYLRKGSPVYIEGQLQTRSWDNKDGQKQYTTEIVMRDFQFLGSKGDSGASDSSASYNDNNGIDDDSIPF